MKKKNIKYGYTSLITVLCILQVPVYSILITNVIVFFAAALHFWNKLWSMWLLKVNVYFTNPPVVTFLFS